MNLPNNFNITDFLSDLTDSETLKIKRRNSLINNSFFKGSNPKTFSGLVHVATAFFFFFFFFFFEDPHLSLHYANIRMQYAEILRLQK